MNTQPAPTLTDRTAPAPYAVCDSCGATPALNLPDNYQECARCHARRVLLQGAEDHLSAAKRARGEWALMAGPLA